MNVYGTNYLTRLFNKKMFKLRLSLIALFTFSHWSIGTKKDKRYACLLYCISTTLSFKFLFMFSSPFQDSLKFFFTYEQWIYMYILSFSFHCLSLFVWKCAGCCRSLPQKVWGERCLSHVIVHSHPHTHCSHCCK